jgi:hypothetical protein
VHLEPDDGVYLGELRLGAVKLSTIIQALTVCGKTREDAVAALGRLLDAGFIIQTDAP